MSPKTAALQHEIESLPPGERYELLRWFVERDDLVTDEPPSSDAANGGAALSEVAGITHTPGVCGGSACIRNSRVPVWTLVSLRNQGMNDDELLLDYPTLNAENLQAAWRYAEGHPIEIARDILENRLA